MEDQYFTILDSSGDVILHSADGIQSPLKTQKALSDGEFITTGEDGSISLLIDSQVIELQPNQALRIVDRAMEVTNLSVARSNSFSEESSESTINVETIV